jgi:hypothetical protein
LPYSYYYGYNPYFALNDPSLGYTVISPQVIQDSSDTVVVPPDTTNTLSIINLSSVPVTAIMTNRMTGNKQEHVLSG